MTRSADMCASDHRIVALRGDADAGTDALQFDVRGDRPESKWNASPNFTPTASRTALTCTAAGAAVLQLNDRSAFVLDAATMTVAAGPPPGIHGNWYRNADAFAPLAPEGGAEVELPSGVTTAVFDAGDRVFAVVNECSLRCPTRDRVETLLRG